MAFIYIIKLNYLAAVDDQKSDSKKNKSKSCYEKVLNN